MANERNPAIGSKHEELVTEPLEDVIDPDGFVPRLLALLSNALVWRESHELRRLFGLGTNDWRVISALALRPGSSATEVSDFLGVNKAVVSKSVSILTARELIVLLDGPRGSRPMYLTQSGARMHHAMMPVSMRGQEIILEGLPQAEVDQLHASLTTMLQKLRVAQANEENARRNPSPSPTQSRKSLPADPAGRANQRSKSEPNQRNAHDRPDTAAEDPSTTGAERSLFQRLRPPSVIRQYLPGGQR